MKRLKVLHLLCSSAVLLAACAGDISPPHAGAISLPGAGGAQASFARNGSYYRGSIDASGSDWVYIDLDTQTQVYPSAPETSNDWDLAFKAEQIKLNGGASGTPPAGQAVVIYGDKAEDGTPYPFDNINAAPPPSAVDYQTDKAGLLGVLPTRLAMSNYPAADSAASDHGWYRNSGTAATPQIAPRINVAYVLRTVECRYYKLRISGYDNAHLTFDVAPITGSICNSNGDDNAVAPLGRASFAVGSASTIITADASDDAAWVHLDLAGAQQTAPTNPTNDASGWDIALRRADIKINGGSSGSGIVRIHDELHDDWDARSSVPANAVYHTDEQDRLAFLTYPPDEAQASAACGGINGDYGWYYYSGFCDDGEGIHHISPRDVVYVIRDHNNAAWKLRITRYYDDAGSAAHFVIEYAPISSTGL